MAMFGKTSSQLAIQVGADTKNAERKLGSVKETLGDLRTRVLSTSTALRALGSSADEASDEIDEEGRSADRTKRSLFGMAAAAGSAKISFGSLSVATAGGLAVSMATLATTLAPVAAGFVAVTAGAGALLGTFGSLLGLGLLSWGDQLASQMEGVSSATEALSKVAGQLKEQLIPIIRPLGDAFVPLLRDAALALPAVVQAMVDAVGSTEEFQTAMREFGMVMARVLPALTSFTFTLARKALPVARSFFNFLLENGGAAFDRIMVSVREFKPEFMAFLDALIEAAPTVLEFGTNVLDTLLPALTGLAGAVAGFLEFINGLSPGLRKVAISGMILAPVITSLSLKIAGLVATLAGPGGLIALIGGSAGAGGLGAALAGLVTPAGIAAAAIAGLAVAWSINLGGMREQTKEVVKDINRHLKGLGRNNLPGSDDFTKSVMEGTEAAKIAQRLENTVGMAPQSRLHQGSQSRVEQTMAAWRKRFEDMFSTDWASSPLNPENFYSQGEKAGQQFSRGLRSGTSLNEMRMQVDRDEVRLKKLREQFKEADKLSRKRAILDKIKKIRNSPGMNLPKGLGPRANEGARGAFLTSGASGGGVVASATRGQSPITQAATGFQQSSTKIKNVSRTFKSAVDKFARAADNLQEIEISGTLREENGEIVAVIDQRVDKKQRDQARAYRRNTGRSKAIR